MEDQTEKMEALKKAYADIILNTSKEAAARVMASERKALRFHHDLRNTKDEALRMLVRFKHMIDVKTAEAETTHLGQQKRIEELDAQLNEAEGVIVDLRAELRNAHERLEEMKNSDMVQSNEPSKKVHTHQENTAHGKKPDVTEQFKCSFQSGRCCNPLKETTTSSFTLPSIIVGNKEPELYRNGYTHRIRAIESNLVDVKIISEDKLDEDICSKKELNNIVDERMSGKCDTSTIFAKTIDTKNINGSEVFSIISSVVKDQNVKTQRRPRNRVRYAQSNRKLPRFCYAQSMKPTTEPKKLNLKKNSRGKGEKLTENNEHSACTLRRSIRKRKVRCWDQISSLFKSRAALSHCKKYLGNDGVKVDEHQCRSKSTNASKESKYDEHTKLVSESVVAKQEIAVKEFVGTSSSNSTTKSDKVPKTDYVQAGNTDKNRLLKYTFSRKRKKVMPSDNCPSVEKKFLIGENKKFGMIEDSSTDSQNLVEVACQLISLSGEHSW